MSLSTLTPKQQDELAALIDECRALGATSSQLAPLIAVIGHGSDGKLAALAHQHPFSD